MSVDPRPPFDVKIREPIKREELKPVWLSERIFQDKIFERRPDVV